MRLLFKQRFFSWLDSYDIYDEAGGTVYTVEGQLAWGHKLVIRDASGREAGVVREEVLTLLPRFALYMDGREVGEIKKGFTFFKPSFRLDCKGWEINGDFFEWDYRIQDANGTEVATISKEAFHWTDTYVIDVRDAQDALFALMIALAIDAAKCSAGNG
ncbi:LURP-one-related/scramblase family protein [Intestinibacillus massiliensis]|uniref:LURP-one-related/scramblase family protein n=1 Tax=Intestinibacillus massiliensis TaxID=1871029 RepID=UPI000B351211|nr:LURP-one-related family protein [Intestinibacillus massiliensis]